ncbi:hypothetical protein E3P86_02654 [Wallemia ichthyophaga]|uniref:Secreted protein n=1 Tax=Wallemia ichthyophaga TaxID=245174 RepID=A0A4T0J6Q5_WALIC|nr:hypothetical protein E3P86_02654 [Wallemia ichthyophaga]
MTLLSVILCYLYAIIFPPSLARISSHTSPTREPAQRKLSDEGVFTSIKAYTRHHRLNKLEEVEEIEETDTNADTHKNSQSVKVMVRFSSGGN